MHTVLRKVDSKYELNTAWDKGVIDNHYGCHGNLDTIATRYVANAYCPKED